ncbi:MAG: cell division ATP-binding protein FtsE [Halieaceae bacterium]|jgi:cell division transport system ATP-binding protein|nr:cell division ATP-binding protein FtsE [Halieaceae bacterium]
MIRFDRVGKRYDNGHDALREVSFEIAPEELVFLTGHSGAGKSTLLRLIMLMERPSRGRVTVNGRDLGEMPRRGVPRHRQSIGVVFQNHKLLMDRSVFDNVALPLQVLGYDDRDMDRRVHAALDKVGLLDRAHDMPLGLSGGEQQRVGIARAVVGRPKILLADEPTGNLDPELSADIMKLFVDFARVGVTVLIASHDLALISRLRHRILTLREGRLLEAGMDGGN